MALLHILEYPHPALRQKAEPILDFENSITQLAENMLETMYQAPGIGLAATQVGITKQLLVMDTSETKDSPLIICNPKIVERSGTVLNEEGCLSFPGIYAQVNRSEQITLEYQDVTGEHQTLEAEELDAICIQHEMDHLVGKVFVDYLSNLKRTRIRKILEKRHRNQKNS